MNNDYCLQSYRNNYQGEGDSAGGGAKAITPNCFRKHESIK